jgi:predicted MFS family arabinose efflux permease
VDPRTEVAARRWLVLGSAMVSFFAVGTTFFAVPPLLGTLRTLFAISNLELGVLMGAIAVPAIVLSVPLGVALDRWPPRAARCAPRL